MLGPSRSATEAHRRDATGSAPPTLWLPPPPASRRPVAPRRVPWQKPQRPAQADRQRQPPRRVVVGPMQDPFVIPEEPTAADAIAAIGDELGVFDDWMERYQFIIELGRKLPPFPHEWADDAHRVPGCQSRVWMEAALRDGKMVFAGTSDAAIVSGLIAL